MSLIVGSQYVGRKNVQVDDVGRLGEEFQLPDISRAPNRFDQVLSGMQVTARLVKFSDGGSGTLSAKDPVSFAVGKYGTEVGAKSVADGIVDGVVDPFLGSTTISPGDTFLLFTRGPCSVIVDGAVATTHVKAAGSGKFADAAFSGASYAKDVDSRVARLLEAASSASDGDTVRVYLNCGAHG